MLMQMQLYQGRQMWNAHQQKQPQNTFLENLSSLGWTPLSAEKTSSKKFNPLVKAWTPACNLCYGKGEVVSPFNPEEEIACKCKTK